MTDMIERIKIELEKRFTNAGFKPITITMKKSGDILKLSPYSESGKVKQLSDIDFILIEGAPASVTGCDTIAEMAEKIYNYDTLLDMHEQNIRALRDYYLQKIKYHKTSELIDGNAYNILLHDKEQKLIDKKTAINIIAEKHNVSVQYVEDAIKLSDACSAYSDWYKYVYGHRPRMNTHIL